MLLCATDGRKFPLHVVFKRKTLPENVAQCLNKGWVNETLLLDWTKSVACSTARFPIITWAGCSLLWARQFQDKTAAWMLHQIHRSWREDIPAATARQFTLRSLSQTWFKRPESDGYRTAEMGLSSGALGGSWTLGPAYQRRSSNERQHLEWTCGHWRWPLRTKRNDAFLKTVLERELQCK